MRTNTIILSALLPLAWMASGCGMETGLASPQLEVYDSRDNAVLSLGSQLQYEADYTCWEYLDISKPDETAQQLPSPKYLVASNMSWRLEPASEEDYEWIRPFPASGNGDGLFCFFVGRYSDQKAPRSAEWVIIANDGNRDIPVGGRIVVTQSPSDEFLKKSAARVEFTADAGKKKLLITSNVPWSYELEPDSAYATEDLSWLVTSLGKSGSLVDTLTFSVEGNLNSIRGAVLSLKYTADGEDRTETVPIVQNGQSVDVEGFPLKWTVGVAGNNFAETWPSEGLIRSDGGSGTIRYVSIDKSLIDTKGAYKLDIDTKYNDPRAIGVWPGDYLQFLSEMPVAKGTILKIAFETRVSASCHKFWRLEYLDGNEWKIAGVPHVTDVTGENVTYTDAFEGGANASANIQVSRTVKYGNTTGRVEFRFICAANWKCSGGALTEPNTASWRLTLTDRSENSEWQPSIQCIAGGSESIVKAEISVSGINDNLVVFEGSPAAPVKFRVKSDNDFTVSSDVDWLGLSVQSGEAGKEYEIELECENSSLATTRRGVVDIVSGISHYVINVVQSAAGQELRPFVSLVEGNSMELGNAEGSLSVQVQANVEYEVECSADWVSVLDVPGTRAMAEVTDMHFTYGRNDTGAERHAAVRFFNREYGIESVLNLKQVSISPEVTVDEVSKTIWQDESSVSFIVTTNLPLDAEVLEGDFSIDADIISPGTSLLTVTALSDAGSYGKIQLHNDDFGWSEELSVRRIQAGLLADWCFTSAKKGIVAGEFSSEAGGASSEEGTMGLAIRDDVGLSMLEYWSVDKTQGANGEFFKRSVAAAGEPYVTAPWKGDYWLFTVNSRKELAAGTRIRYQFQIRNTNSAQKCWTVEYLDSGEWKPALGIISTAAISGNVITFPSKTGYVTFEGELVLGNASKGLKLRIVAGENDRADGKGTVTETATSRVGSSGDGSFHNLFEIIR